MDQPSCTCLLTHQEQWLHCNNNIHNKNNHVGDNKSNSNGGDRYNEKKTKEKMGHQHAQHPNHGLLLARGPNFAVVPKHPLKENMWQCWSKCANISPKSTVGLRVDTNRFLNKVQLPNPVPPYRNPGPSKN